MSNLERLDPDVGNVNMQAADFRLQTSASLVKLEGPCAFLLSDSSVTKSKEPRLSGF